MLAAVRAVSLLVLLAAAPVVVALADAAPADAGPEAVTGSSAQNPDALPALDAAPDRDATTDAASSPAERHETEAAARERQDELARARAEAERARRQAESAQQQALAATERAASRAEALLSAEKARLHALEERQARFWKERFLDGKAALAAARERFESEREASAAIDDPGERHDRTRAALARVHAAALADLRDLLAGMPAVPAPEPRLPRDIRELPTPTPRAASPSRTCARPWTPALPAIATRPAPCGASARPRSTARPAPSTTCASRSCPRSTPRAGAPWPGP